MHLETIEEIRALVAETIERCGCADHPIPPIKFNRRFTRALGCLRWHREERRADSIEFSAQAWPHLTLAERRQTVIHEACHLADAYKRGDSDHSWRWRTLMLKCGESPDRTMRTTYTPPRRANTRPRVSCTECGALHRIPKRAERMWLDGAARCAKCRTPLPTKEAA